MTQLKVCDQWGKGIKVKKKKTCMKERQRQNMGISQHDRFPLPMLAAVYGQFQVMYFEISCEIDA